MAQPHELPWNPLSPAETVALFASWDRFWCIAGGWSIDLNSGRQSREHEDVDVLVLRRDLDALHAQLPGWELWVSWPPGTLIPWREGEPIHKKAHDIWCREAETDRWRFQLMVMDHDDASAILYTSGTTGTPKGACLSHGNVVSNMHAFNYNCGMRPDDRLLLFLPLFHCFGQNAIMNSAFNAGSTVVLHRTFQPANIVRSISDDGVTMFFGVPTTFIPIYNLTSAGDLSSVRYYFSAAASLPRELARKWQEKYQRPIHEGYGLTETSPFASYNHRLWYKLGSIGAPIENVEMRVVDLDTNAEVPTGESGELVIRGPNVMLGYWKRPEATASAIRNGWFHTGDIGRVDEDGYFYIVDRLKDMVNVNGLKVYPVEVENTIYQHPAVEEVAVYGVADKSLSERVCANIVRKAGHELGEAEVIAFCREQLADYKVPSTVLFVDALPKSPTGKILKRVLRDQGQELVLQARAADAREIETWVRGWITENLAIDGTSVAADRSFFDYGMTSLTGLKLSSQLGTWLGHPLEDVLV